MVQWVKCFNHISKDLGLDPEDICEPTHGSACLQSQCLYGETGGRQENPQMFMGQYGLAYATGNDTLTQTR